MLRRFTPRIWLGLAAAASVLAVIVAVATMSGPDPADTNRAWDAYFACLDIAQTEGAAYTEALDRCVSLSP